MASDTPRVDAFYRQFPIDEYEHQAIAPDAGSQWLDFARVLERELAAANARAASARRELDAIYAWLDNNTSHYDVDADYPVEGHNIPVLAQVSNRIWYHATDDISAYPFSALIRALINAAPPSEQSVQAPSGGQPQETASAATPWISVADAMPREYQHVIVLCDDGIVPNALMTRKSGKWWIGDSDDEYKYVITHWLPLPAAPNTAAVAQQVAGCPPLNAEDKRHGNPPPPAVPIPELPLAPGTISFRWPNDHGVLSDWITAYDYDTLRAVAERLREGWVECKQTLADSIEYYVRECQRLRERAERAEAECEWLRECINHIESAIIPDPADERDVSSEWLVRTIRGHIDAARRERT